MRKVKGYKVFRPDWTCLNYKYEVGKTYEIEGELQICENGFHFCKKAVDCFNYYDFDTENKVAEVEALGEVVEDNDKCCTNKIKIVREIEWQEVLGIVNTGKCCTGRGNSGSLNSGSWNSGDWNSGSGNSGSWNSGSWNSGDWNNASNCAGCFNTTNSRIQFFNRTTNITIEEWRDSVAYWLMNRIKLTKWISSSEMTEEEKEEHPEHKTTGGFLKEFELKVVCKDWWSKLTDDEKQIIKNIPNFDPEIFYEITGIMVEDERK